MNTYSLIGFSVVTAIAAFTVKQYNPQIAVHVSLAGGAVVALAVLAELSGIVSELNALAAEGGASSATVGVIIKAVGIAYLSRLGAELCRDIGENALAIKAEIVGRVMLLSLALPLIANIASILMELIRSSL